jgi:hypothetical protein
MISAAAQHRQCHRGDYQQISLARKCFIAAAQEYRDISFNYRRTHAHSHILKIPLTQFEI